MRLIALFNLKPGVSVDIYEEWAKTVDLPVVNALASVESFKVYRATGVLGSDAKPPYGYVEILDIPDMDAFGKDVSGSTMQSIAAAFQEMVDVTFLTTEPVTA
jgi:hypothetical protein